MYIIAFYSRNSDSFVYFLHSQLIVVYISIPTILHTVFII